MTRRNLLDANHLGTALAPVSRIRERIHHAHLRGEVFGTCIPVIYEVQVGLNNTNNPRTAFTQLRRLLVGVKIWPMEADLAMFYADVYHDVKRQGRTLSQVDMMLAALTRQMNLTLLTTDRDFEALPDIRVENWVG
jgi:tRNA(fMet)-specific endonuclease VapC